MKHRTKLIIITSAIVIGIGLFAAIVFSAYSKMTARPVSADRHDYDLYKVSAAPSLSMSGKIVAARTQALDSPSGRLQKVFVSDGDKVKNGEILLTVTDTETENAVSAQRDTINKAARTASGAANALSTAQQNYNQADSETKASLQDAVTQARQAVTDANNDLQDERNKLASLQTKLNVNLTAPFDGVVTVSSDTKNGIPNFTINSTEKNLQASVSEYDYNKIHANDPITVSGIDNTPRQQTTITKIEQIPNSQGRGTAYYPFSARVDDNFLYGQSVKIKIEQKELKIPKSAVYKGSIYKVIRGRSNRVKADVTPSGADFIVKSGLLKDETIVLNPDAKLKNGEKLND